MTESGGSLSSIKDVHSILDLAKASIAILLAPQELGHSALQHSYSPPKS